MVSHGRAFAERHAGEISEGEQISVDLPASKCQASANSLKCAAINMKHAHYAGIGIVPVHRFMMISAAL